MNEDTNIKEFIQLKNKIIRTIVKDLFKNKIVCTRNNNLLNEGELVNILINTSNKVEKCIGITINNNIPTQCSRNSLIDGYCKKHYKKYQAKKNKDNIDSKNITYEIERHDSRDSHNSHEIEVNKLSIKCVDGKKTKKFINDSFYYVDDKFIYSLDLKSGSIYTKVGYIKNGEYILSDDPFILNTDYISF